MKAPSPLLGFNNNFKHKGQVYHIQTEDSGVKHPHIITHLFADGGRILKSIKTSYATYVGDPMMGEVVKQMMKEQHKAMIVALRDGAFDAGGTKEVKLPSTGYFAASTNAGQVQRVSKQQPAVEPRADAERPPEAEAKADPDPLGNAPTIEMQRPGVPPAPELERAAQAVATKRAQQAFEPQTDLPPPPANLLSQRPTDGGYATVRGRSRPPTPVPGAVPAAKPSARPPAASASVRPPSSPSVRPPGQKTPTGRYALTRPASIFATSKPAAQGSVFGEDLLSERSLDEVILGYLADDLEGDKK
jgi:hypothetical protein